MDFAEFYTDILTWSSEKIEGDYVKGSTKRNWQLRKLRSKKIFGSSLGGALGIGAVAFISQYTEYGFIIPPFGATCVIAFVIPKSAFAKPRSIIGGHVLASVIGMVCCDLFGQAWWTFSLAVALSIALMQLTRTLHPPAAADPVFIIMQGGVPWDFIFHPVLLGSTLLVTIAIFYNRYIAQKQFLT